MRIPSKPAADDVSEASDEATETSSPSEMTSPLESALTINVDPADTHGHSTKANLEDLVRAQFVQLDLSRRSNDGLNSPSTARDLYDASPRASPSPEPRQRGEQPSPDLAPTESHGDQLTSPIIAGLQHLELGGGPKTYNVKDEALPVMPVFDKKFQSCLKSGKAIADSIHANLSACSLAIEGGSELGRLRASAGRLRSFESPATRLVGIVGDSAAGKSSLINSLLDIPDLAHKGDHGSAVTSFVTEYHRRSSQHAAPFTIEVEYCNETEIDEQLHELLVSYRELYQPGLEKELENNEALYREIETKSTVAASTLQSIFPDHPEVAPTQLREQGEGAFERILHDLKRLASLIQWPSDAADGKWTATASSPSECHDKVAYFMEKGLWPLTNIVRQELSLPTSRVIDLPGAERKYKGVVTSKEGQRTLRARKDAWGRRGLATAAQKADTEYKYLFVSARNTDVERALRLRYDSPGAGFSINVFCVGNRDYEGAEYQSQEAHQRAIQGSGVPDLRRFCHSIVAQAQYDASLHFLEVELASLLQSLEVWLSVSEQKNLVTVDPQIITDLQANLEQKIDDFAEELEDTLESNILDSMSHYDRGFNDYALDVSEEWTGVSHVTSDIESWLTRHLVALLVIQSFLPPKRKSLHTSSRLKILERRAAGRHDRFNDEPVARNGDCTIGARQTASNVRGQRLQEHERRIERYQAHGAPATILASFRLKQRELTYLLKDACFETRREVQYARENIEFNAMGDHISSFILDLMIPTYRACATETGKGTMSRMHQTMRRRLDRRDIFDLIRRRIQTETQELFVEKTDSVRDHVIEMSESIRCQLETFNGPELETQKRNPREVDRVRAFTETVRDEGIALQRALEDFKKSMS
ncbi:MAG: hypothetical protein Q9199_007731 [Rusavskia elegans]